MLAARFFSGPLRNPYGRFLPQNHRHRMSHGSISWGEVVCGRLGGETRHVRRGARLFHTSREVASEVLSVRSSIAANIRRRQKRARRLQRTTQLQSRPEQAQAAMVAHGSVSFARKPPSRLTGTSSPMFLRIRSAVGNTGYMMVLLAYLTDDMLHLRLLMLCSGLCTIVFSSMHSPPITIPIFWCTVFFLLNAYKIWRLQSEGKDVEFSEEALDAYESTFQAHGITPRQFQRLLRAGATFQDAYEGDILVKQGEPIDRVVFLLRGEADLLLGGKWVATLNDGSFATSLLPLLPQEGATDAATLAARVARERAERKRRRTGIADEHTVPDASAAAHEEQEYHDLSLQFARRQASTSSATATDDETIRRAEEVETARSMIDDEEEERMGRGRTVQMLARAKARASAFANRIREILYEQGVKEEEALALQHDAQQPAKVQLAMLPETGLQPKHDAEATSDPSSDPSAISSTHSSGNSPPLPLAARSTPYRALSDEEPPRNLNASSEQGASWEDAYAAGRKITHRSNSTVRVVSPSARVLVWDLEGIRDAIEADKNMRYPILSLASTEIALRLSLAAEQMSRQYEYREFLRGLITEDGFLKSGARTQLSKYRESHGVSEEEHFEALHSLGWTKGDFDAGVSRSQQSAHRARATQQLFKNLTSRVAGWAGYLAGGWLIYGEEVDEPAWEIANEEQIWPPAPDASQEATVAVGSSTRPHLPPQSGAVDESPLDPVQVVQASLDHEEEERSVSPAALHRPAGGENPSAANQPKEVSAE